MKITKTLVKKGGKKSLKKTLKMRKSKKGGKKGGKKSLNTKKARKTRKMKGAGMFDDTATAYDCSGKGSTEVSYYDKTEGDGKSTQQRMNERITEKAEKEGKVPVVEENMVEVNIKGDSPGHYAHYYKKAGPLNPAVSDAEKEKRKMLCYIPDDQDKAKAKRDHTSYGL